MIQTAPQTAPLSQVHKDALSISTMLESGPVMMMRNSSSFGMLVSIEQWNKMAAAMQYFEEMEEIVELLKLEIDRLESGTKDGDFDMNRLKSLAGRVPA